MAERQRSVILRNNFFIGAEHYLLFYEAKLAYLGDKDSDDGCCQLRG